MRTLGSVLMMGLLFVGAGMAASTHPMVQGNTQFALDLYRTVAKEPGNIFFSPYSLSAALGMTSAGAKGNTLKEMNSALHFPAEGPHAGYSELDKAIFGEGKSYTLRTANRLWLQEGSPYYPSFKNLLKTYYGADAGVLNFQRETEKSRQVINQWVSDQTNTKIPELLKPGIITIDTDAVLTNAIYFKATWEEGFKKSDTRKAPFFSPGKEVTIDMMFQSSHFLYGEDDLAQTIELPYQGKDLSMVIVLPKNNNSLKAVEERFLLDGGRSWTKGHWDEKVDLYLPAFKVRWTRPVNKDLANLGIKVAFDENKADFTGMRPRGHRNLFISAVIHEAFVEVNEEGTEAAAATAVVVASTMATANPTPVFRADHPFLYFIQHRPTGTILFMGRLVNPLPS